MFKLWTLTILAGLCVSTSVLGASVELSQEQWRQVLTDLKHHKPNALQAFENAKPDAMTVGPGTSGGGNGADTEFFYLGDQLLGELQALKTNSSFITLSVQAFAKLRNDKSLYFTTKSLWLDHIEKAAINDFEVFALVVNETKWNHSSFSQKRQLILHELLGLSRRFDKSVDDSDYRISQSLLSKLEKADQRNLLLNTDYPAVFNAPILSSFKATSVGEVTLVRGGKSVCTQRASGLAPIEFEFKSTKASSAQHYSIATNFRIHCVLSDSETYGHSQGGEDEEFELGSSNLLIGRSVYGSFVFGWISGREVFIRNNYSTVSFRQVSRDRFQFRLEFFKGPNSQPEIVTGLMKID